MLVRVLFVVNVLWGDTSAVLCRLDGLEEMSDMKLGFKQGEVRRISLLDVGTLRGSRRVDFQRDAGT